MTLSRIIIAGVIASIGIFATAVIQNKILTMSGSILSFTGAEILVAPAIAGAVIFVGVLGRLSARM